MWRGAIWMTSVLAAIVLAEGHTGPQLYLRRPEAPDFKLPNGSTDTYFSVEDEIGGNRADLQPQKRVGQLSLNQDLKTLARLLQSNHVRRTSNAIQKLRIIGKRERVLPTFSFPFLHSYFQQKQDLSEEERYKRGVPRLSVSGALSTIADMVKAQSRRRLLRQMAANRASLAGIGKRDEDSEESVKYLTPVSTIEDSSLEDREGFA